MYWQKIDSGTLSELAANGINVTGATCLGEIMQNAEMQDIKDALKKAGAADKSIDLNAIWKVQDLIARGQRPEEVAENVASELTKQFNLSSRKLSR